MKTIQTMEDFEIDFKKAGEIAKTYSRSVGAGCIVIDGAGATVADACGDGQSGLCKKILSNGCNCAKAHLYGGYQAERFGGRYIFFCPIGLVHWASPITADGSMKGAFLGGPVLMTEPDDLLLDEIMTKGNISKAEIKEIEKLVHEIPVVSPEKVSDLSELLFMVSTQVAQCGNALLQTERESLAQQSEISEYIHHIKTMGGESNEIASYPVEKEKELLLMISLGDKAGSQKVLNEILGHVFFASGGDFEVIKARILELIVLLSRAALEGGADVEQIFGLNYNYLSQIHNFDSTDELTYWLSGIMTRFTDCVFNLTDVKHIDVIYKAVDYIKRNYMKKIALEDVASHVQLSMSYFCAIFKRDMKCNFNTYVNRIRIEMSKKLLADSTIPLVDVANLVGYEDQSYFTKVFRNRVGVSPGKYRREKVNL